MNGRAIAGAYLFRLYVCDKEMSWPHHIGETHQPEWVVYIRDSEKFRLTRFRLTNVILERIFFVSRGITVQLSDLDVKCIKQSEICNCHEHPHLESEFNPVYITIKLTHYRNTLCEVSSQKAVSECMSHTDTTNQQMYCKRSTFVPRLPWRARWGRWKFLRDTGGVQRIHT